MDVAGEVTELRNKLRMMKFPQDEIINLVRRQHRTISKQRSANDTLKQEISQYQETISNYDKDIIEYQSDEKILGLESQKKVLMNKLGILQADFKAELDKKSILEEEVSRARSKFGSQGYQRPVSATPTNSRQIIENKLNLALNKYNGNLVVLDKLRNEIDELRKQKLSYYDLRNKMDEEEKQRNNTISQLISESNESYSDRDRIRMELARLKSAEKEDEHISGAEVKRLKQQINGNDLLYNQNRSTPQPIASGFSQSENGLDSQETLQQEIDAVSNQISEILSTTGYSSVTELTECFKVLEAENFSLFNIVIENNNQISSLREMDIAAHNKMESLKREHEEVSNVHSIKIHDINRDIEEKQEQIASIENILNQRVSNIENINTELTALFNILGCSWEGSPDEKPFATQNNAHFVMSSIEDGINQQMKHILERASSESVSIIREKPSTLSSEDRLHSCAKLPLISKTFEKELLIKTLDCTKPMSLDEVRQKVKNV